MPPWLSIIKYYQKTESDQHSYSFVQLATVSKDNTPRVRTVVLRGWTNTYQLIISTDKRSEKYSELESNNNVEICYFFPKSECQFRLGGKSEIEMGNDKLIHWDKLEFIHEDLKKKESYADQLIITESFLIDTYSKNKYLPNFVKAKKIYLIKNIEFLLNGIIYIDNEYINLLKYEKWKDKNLISSAECKVEEINPKDLITKT